jgi:hypothetical protein
VVLQAGIDPPGCPRGLDIVEFPLNVNGKKFWKAVSGQPSAISENFRFWS